MNEYRCTRNQPYLDPRCFGHTDLETRQGYYIKAESEQDAIAQMTELYPDDNAGFTATKSENRLSGMSRQGTTDASRHDAEWLSPNRQPCNLRPVPRSGTG
jgi:hypothetical protein